MKKIYLSLIVVMLVFLTSCSGLSYKSYGKEIGSYSVFQYDAPFSQIECDRIAPFVVFYEDDGEYYLGRGFSECRDSLYIKHKGSYIDLSSAISKGLITKSDIDSVEWDFPILESHFLLDYLEVDYFVFRYESKELVFDDYQAIEELLEEENLPYELFVVDGVDIEISNYDVLGYIDVFSNNQIEVTLTVTSEGLYDQHMNSFQYAYGSTLFSWFNNNAN